MTMESALREGRAAAERAMIDQATVRGVTGLATDDQGATTSTYSEPVYVGRCKVQTTEGLQGNPEVAGATATVQRYRVDFPVGSFRPEVGLVVDITAAALDPNLVGRQFRVVALLHKTAATAYRLAVEEVS